MNKVETKTEYDKLLSNFNKKRSKFTKVCKAITSYLYQTTELQGDRRNIEAYSPVQKINCNVPITSTPEYTLWDSRRKHSIKNLCKSFITHLQVSLNEVKKTAPDKANDSKGNLSWKYCECCIPDNGKDRKTNGEGKKC